MRIFFLLLLAAAFVSCTPKKPFILTGYELLPVEIRDTGSLFPSVNTRAYIVCEVSSKLQLSKLAGNILEHLYQRADIKALKGKEIKFYIWLYETKRKAENKEKWVAWLKAINEEVPEIFFDEANTDYQ